MNGTFVIEMEFSIVILVNYIIQVITRNWTVYVEIRMAKVAVTLTL